MAEGVQFNNFKMLKPKELKEVLVKGLGPQIYSAVLFSMPEGSIIVKAESVKDRSDNITNSQSAVLAIII